MENLQNMQSAINEMIKSIRHMIEQAMKGTTQCYNGIVTVVNADGTYQVQLNGQVANLSVYGNYTPTVNEIVKVLVPQGNMSVAFILPK